MEEVDSSSKFFGKDPTDTETYVKYLEFIDSCQIRLDEMENELEYCKDLYDMMEEFEIPIPTYDMQNYLGLSTTMGTLRNLSDSKAEEKEKYIKGFVGVLNKDISKLISEVGTIKDKCLVSLKIIFVYRFIYYSYIIHIFLGIIFIYLFIYYSYIT